MLTDSGGPIWKDCEIAVLQRISTEPTLRLMHMLKDRGVPTILDMDDNLHQVSRWNPAFEVYSNGKKGTKIFEQALVLADYVTVSTKRLADDYAKFRDEFVICENFIPSWAFKQLAPAAITGLEKRAGSLRVGYVGSSSHQEDMLILAKPLRKLVERHPNVTLVFFGTSPQDLPDLVKGRVEYHGYVDPAPEDNPNQFFAKYWTKFKTMQLDVALIPIQPNLFNAGKSFLKVMEYGAVGWPCIATNFGPYRDYRSRNPEGIVLADTEKEWVAALETLLEEHSGFERRKSLAISNFCYVRDHHTTEFGILPWRKLLARIVHERKLRE
jgi:glycosyltransferase involved in cell wall biosynthesis